MGQRLAQLARRRPRASTPQIRYCAVWMVFCVLTAAAGMAESITLQLLNGKNGKPIAKVKVYISFPDDAAKKALQFMSDSRGEIQFEVKGLKTFQVHQIGYGTCDEQPVGSQPRAYPIDRILDTGLVGANNCGHMHVQPEPGRLVFFVRYGAWGEWLKQ
jgi:hypothetical protein